MTKYFTLFFLVIGLIFKINSQNINYIEYKKDCNNSYLLALDSSKYERSIKYLIAIEKKYNFLSCEEYVLMAFCYKKINRGTKSAKSLKKAWSNYAFDMNCLMQIDEIQPSEIMTNFSKRQNEIVNKGFKKFAKLKSNISDSLMQVFTKIDSLDQIPRSKPLLDTSAVSKKLHFNEIYRTDSINLSQFKNIIYKFGYPGERLLPGNSESSLLILIHSAYNQKFYDEMKPIFLEEVKKGRMSPSHYVLWLDRHNLAFKLPLEYGILDLLSENKFTEIEKKEIYKKRMDLGLIKHFPLPSKLLQF